MKAKKLLALVLSLVLIVGLFPATALASAPSNVAIVVGGNESPTKFDTIGAALQDPSVKALLDNGSVFTIKLLDATSEAAAVTIPATAEVILDLNGKTATITTAGTGISNAGKLTIKDSGTNGIITAGSVASVSAITNSGTLALEKAIIVGTSGTAAPAIVNTKDMTISKDVTVQLGAASETAIKNGNGTAAATLTVTGATIDADGNTGVGIDNQAGATLTVTGATFTTGLATAITSAAATELNVTNATITGATTAVAATAGKVNVTGGTIGGAVTTGTAVTETKIENVKLTGTVTAGSGTLSITGGTDGKVDGTVTANTAATATTISGVEVAGAVTATTGTLEITEQSKTGAVTVGAGNLTINDSTVAGKIENTATTAVKTEITNLTNTAGGISVAGGTLSVTGSEITTTGTNNGVSVAVTEAVTKVDVTNTKITLGGAGVGINNLGTKSVLTVEGTTITGATGANGVVNAYKATLTDNTVTTAGAAVKNSAAASETTISGSKGNYKSTTNTAEVLDNAAGGKLTIEDGVFTSGSAAQLITGANSAANVGTVLIKNGTFTYQATTGASGEKLVKGPSADGGTTTISGGKFSSDVSKDVSWGTAKSFVASGLVASKMSNGYYYVMEPKGSSDLTSLKFTLAGDVEKEVLTATVKGSTSASAPTVLPELVITQAEVPTADVDVTVNANYSTVDFNTAIAAKTATAATIGAATYNNGANVKMDANGVSTFKATGFFSQDALGGSTLYQAANLLLLKVSSMDGSDPVYYSLTVKVERDVTTLTHGPKLDDGATAIIAGNTTYVVDEDRDDTTADGDEITAYVSKNNAARTNVTKYTAKSFTATDSDATIELFKDKTFATPVTGFTAADIVDDELPIYVRVTAQDGKTMGYYLFVITYPKSVSTIKTVTAVQTSGSNSRTVDAPEVSASNADDPAIINMKVLAEAKTGLTLTFNGDKAGDVVIAVVGDDEIPDGGKIPAATAFDTTYSGYTLTKTNISSQGTFTVEATNYFTATGLLASTSKPIWVRVKSEETSTIQYTYYKIVVTVDGEASKDVDLTALTLTIGGKKVELDAAALGAAGVVAEDGSVTPKAVSAVFEEHISTNDVNAKGIVAVTNGANDVDAYIGANSTVLTTSAGITGLSAKDESFVKGTSNTNEFTSANNVITYAVANLYPIYIVVTAEDGTTKGVYVVNVTNPAASSEKLLKSLTLTIGGKDYPIVTSATQGSTGSVNATKLKELEFDYGFSGDISKVVATLDGGKFAVGKTAGGGEIVADVAVADGKITTTTIVAANKTINATTTLYVMITAEDGSHAYYQVPITVGEASEDVSLKTAFGSTVDVTGKTGGTALQPYEITMELNSANYAAHKIVAKDFVLDPTSGKALWSPTSFIQNASGSNVDTTLGMGENTVYLTVVPNIYTSDDGTNAAKYVYFKLTVNVVDKATLDSIAVKTAPTTVDYKVGDKFDPTGLVLTLTYSDNTTEDVTYTEGNAADFTFVPNTTAELTAENSVINITYGGRSATQEITVTEEKTFKLTISADANATVTTDKTDLESFKTGDTVKVTVAAKDGYELESVTAGTAAQTITEKTKSEFTLTFAEADITVTVKSKEAGAVSIKVPDGVTYDDTKSYKPGEDVTFIVGGEENIVAVTATGATQKGDADGRKYTFTIAANATEVEIKVQYEGQSADTVPATTDAATGVVSEDAAKAIGDETTTVTATATKSDTVTLPKAVVDAVEAANGGKGATVEATTKDGKMSVSPAALTNLKANNDAGDVELTVKKDSTVSDDSISAKAANADDASKAVVDEALANGEIKGGVEASIGSDSVTVTEGYITITTTVASEADVPDFILAQSDKGKTERYEKYAKGEAPTDGRGYFTVDGTTITIYTKHLTLFAFGYNTTPETTAPTFAEGTAFDKATGKVTIKLNDADPDNYYVVVNTSANITEKVKAVSGLTINAYPSSSPAFSGDLNLVELYIVNSDVTATDASAVGAANKGLDFKTLVDTDSQA